MADPKAAQLTQLRNIQTKTGQSIQGLHDQLAKTGLTKVGEKRSWLMEQFKLGYGDANTVALMIGKLPAELDGAAVVAASPSVADSSDSLYVGAKAHLLAVHNAVIEAINKFGSYEQAPKKTYVSLRRKKQFAMIGPATKDAIEIGLNAKDLPAHARLKAIPPGGMCQATTRLTSVAEVDANLIGWLKRAYDAAG